MEFLASFKFDASEKDIFEDSIRYRIGGRWHDSSVAEFGQDLGLYELDDTWAGGIWTFPDEELKGDNDRGKMRNRFWRQIARGRYDPSVTKSTKIKDPLLRYIHRLLSHTIAQRGNAGGVVNLRELLCLYCMVNDEPCNLGYLFAQLFAMNSQASVATPMFGGGWIIQLYESHGVDTYGTPSPPPGLIDLPLCRSMQMVADIQGQGPRFVDYEGHVWDPEDPNQVIMHIDQPQHQEPPQFQPPPFQQPPQHQYEAGSSSQAHPDGFPSMMDLWNGLTESRGYSLESRGYALQARDYALQGRDYARQAYEQAQTTNTELAAWSGRMDQFQTDLSYMRGRMDHHWGPGDDMPRDDAGES